MTGFRHSDMSNTGNPTQHPCFLVPSTIRLEKNNKTVSCDFNFLKASNTLLKTALFALLLKVGN